MRTQTANKYAAIRKSYKQWDKKRYKGVKIYTDPYIFTKLAEKYFMQPSTIENIVYSRTN